MLIQALAEYADNYLAEELYDPAWESKRVPWLLEISTQGTFSKLVPHVATVTRGRKQLRAPLEMRVPRSPVNRNSGHHPLLASDDIAYVLGVGQWTPNETADREKTEKHHEAFVALITRAAKETGDASLEACAKFYDDPSEVNKARAALQESKGGTWVALSVEGPVVDSKTVQQFWRQHYEVTFAAERIKGSKGECMISGKFGDIVLTHEKIKGVTNLGGRAEVGLMSFDKGAFRSYGWEQNQNSSVSPDRALAYVLALNNLLKPGSGKRRDISGIGFLYWLKNPGDIFTLDLVKHAGSGQVKDLLNFKPEADPNPNRFYMIGISGNGGRLRVHYWADMALRDVKRNLQNWHQQLRTDYPWEASQPIRFWQLLYAIDRKGEPEGHRVSALLRRAIEGLPLGYSMLSTALSRLRQSCRDVRVKEEQRLHVSAAAPCFHEPDSDVSQRFVPTNREKRNE